jgi:hypothetical protein
MAREGILPLREDERTSAARGCRLMMGGNAGTRGAGIRLRVRSGQAKQLESGHVAGLSRAREMHEHTLEGC